MADDSEPVSSSVESAAYAPGFSPVPKRGSHTLPCGKVITDPPCCVTGVTVKCGHGSRAFTLKPPTTKTDKDYRQIIQVLAESSGKSSGGHQPCYDDVTVDLFASSCTRGFANKPAITLRNDLIQGKKTFRFEGPPNPPAAFPLVGFMRSCLSRYDPDAHTYMGTVDCCTGAEEYTFAIQVFAYKAWSGSITVGYELGMDTQTIDKSEVHDELVYNHGEYDVKQVVKAKQGSIYTLKDRGVFKVSASISAQYGSATTTIASPTYERAGKASTTPGVPFASTKAFFEKWLPRLNCLCNNNYVTLTPLWPNVSLGGGMSTAEVTGAYNVGWDGNLTFAANPLIGLKGTSDILSWLIMGGASVFGVPPTITDKLISLKKKAEKGFGNDKFGGKVVCKIELTASGQVGGSLKWTYHSQAQDMVQGTLTADLDISLTGEVSGEVRAFVVSYIAGVSIAGKSGLNGTITATFYGDAPAFGAGLTFKGLSIEAVAYMSVGGSNVGNDPKGADKAAMRKAQDEGRIDGSTTRAKDSDSEWTIVLLEPHVLWEKHTAFNQPGSV